MGDNAECVAEFVSKTAADSSVAQVLLKITENSVEDAVQLFHSISDEKVIIRYTTYSQTIEKNKIFREKQN